MKKILKFPWEKFIVVMLFMTMLAGISVLFVVFDIYTILVALITIVMFTYTVIKYKDLKEAIDEVRTLWQ